MCVCVTVSVCLCVVCVCVHVSVCLCRVCASTCAQVHRQTGGEEDGSKGSNGRFTSLPGSSLCMREMQSVSAKEV